MKQNPVGLVQRFKSEIKIITAALSTKNVTLGDIEIIPGEEKKRLLLDFNNTATDFPGDKTTYDFFEEQASAVPHKIALIGSIPGTSVRMEETGEPVQITYKELNERSYQLACRIIKEKKVQTDTIVGIIAERTVEMVVGLLGILKAGGAYMPIDPDYPENRITFMLEDSNAPILITQTDQFDTVKARRGRVMVSLSNLLVRQSRQTGKKELENTAGADSPAYVIYTSGSTGRPKGVMVEHKNVVRLVMNTNYIDWREGDKLLLTGAITFDITTFEIWGSLLNRSELVLVDRNTDAFQSCPFVWPGSGIAYFCLSNNFSFNLTAYLTAF